MWGAIRNAAAIASRAVEETTKQANDLLEKLDGAITTSDDEDRENDSGALEYESTDSTNLASFKENIVRDSSSLKEEITSVVTIKNQENAQQPEIVTSDPIDESERQREDDFERRMIPILELLQKTQQESLLKDNKINNLQLEINSLLKDNQTFQHTNELRSNIDNQIQYLEEEISNKEAIILELTTKISEQSNILNDFNHKYSEEHQLNNATIEDLRLKLSSNISNLTKIENENLLLQEKNEELLKYIENIHKQILVTQNELQSTQKLYSDLEKEKQQWLLDRDQLELEIDRLQSDKNGLESEKDSTMKLLQDGLLAERDTLLLQISQLRDEHDQLKSDLESASAANSEAAKKHRKELRALRDKLRAEADNKIQELQLQVRFTSFVRMEDRLPSLNLVPLPVESRILKLLKLMLSFQ